jgi:hypothetical protein
MADMTTRTATSLHGRGHYRSGKELIVVKEMAANRVR